MVFQCGKPGNHPQLPMTRNGWLLPSPHFGSSAVGRLALTGGRVQGRATAVCLKSQATDFLGCFLGGCMEQEVGDNFSAPVGFRVNGSMLHPNLRSCESHNSLLAGE